ncbi:glycosyl hydrolase family 65 protein [Salinifilum ghardaiensis]
MRYSRTAGLFGSALLAATLAGAPPASAGPSRADASPGGSDARAAGAAAEDPRCAAGPGWEMSTRRLDDAYTRHAFVGNGLLSQRVPPNGMGYAATGEETGFPLETPRYDGAFVAGTYGKAPTSQSPRQRRAIAALPTWSTLNVGTGEHQYTSDTPAGRISGFEQTLNVRCGLLSTSLTWTAPDGRKTDLVYEVLADRADRHVGAVRVTVTPHYSGEVRVTDALDGRGARRMHATGGGRAGSTQHVSFSTTEVGDTGSLASTLRAGPGVRAEPAGHGRDGLTARQRVAFPVQQGRSYQLTKFVGVDTGRQHADAAAKHSRSAADRGWDGVWEEHVRKWLQLWRSDVRTPGREDMQRWLRSTRYAVLSSTRAEGAHALGPAGLSSDNYAGLAFWDTELWMYPNLLLQNPEIAKSMVEYREKLLPAAKRNASAIGQQGAFYPWTSANSGDLQEDCHSWDPPHCLTQNHLQSDVAFAAWQYYLATGDRQWLREHGWPVMREIARYWAGRVTPNDDGSYSIENVAGPDEYSNGVDDGVFTNAGAAIALRKAARAAQVIGADAPQEWRHIADNLRIPFDAQNERFVQYAGYDGHEIKQADTVLLQYPLEWPMSDEVARNTLDYYAQRTDPDGPAMTDAVHAIDAAEIGEPGCVTNTYLERSVRPFMEEPFAQFSEARGETAGEDAGAPALNFLTGGGGFQQAFTHGLTGLRLREDAVELDPMLPPQLAEGGVELTGLHWQGRTFDVRLGGETSTVELRSGEPFTVRTPEGERVVSDGAPLTMKTRRPDRVPTDNVARCQPAQATSAEPGKYAEAAVDGSEATAWVLDERSGALTADLGRPQQVGRIVAQFSEVRPEQVRLSTSLDGEHFTPTPAEPENPRLARFVRVELTGPADAEKHAGLRELRVE